MQKFEDCGLHEGIFLKELKNRFLCEVLIDDKEVECYVPSSCHLSNFINITNLTVLLKKNKEGSRTEYSLFAFKFRKKYVLLNTSVANKVIYDNLYSKIFDFLGIRKKLYKEYKFENYKSDIYIEDSKSFIEIKSLLSLDDSGIFPTIYSERSNKQLTKFIDLLGRGYNVFFVYSFIKSVFKNNTN